MKPANQISRKELAHSVGSIIFPSIFISIAIVYAKLSAKVKSSQNMKQLRLSLLEPDAAFCEG